MRRTSIVCALVAALAATVLPVGAEEAAVDQSDNVTFLDRFETLDGTELDFDNGILFAGQNNGRDAFGSKPGQGGVYMFDTREGRLDLLTKLQCAGYDNDVKVVRPGLVVVSHHSTQRSCNRTLGDGMFLVDVSDPANPQVRGGVSVGSGSAHTVTVHPSGDYVYVNPGGLANGGGLESVVDVRDPLSPRVVSQYRSSRIGCHDVGFHPTEPFAYCAGLGEVQVWDVSNPESPVTVGTIVNPAIQFAHNAQVTPDGTKLVINDEAFGFHECETGTSVFGSLWIYDIRIPDVPVLAGRIAPAPSRSTVGHYVGWSGSWCTAHNYNFIPGTNIVITSWFTGGTTVHDISDPLQPELLAWYRPEDADAYTAHWFDDRIYINDANRGIEMIEVAGLPLEGSPGAEAMWTARPRVDLTPVLVPSVLPEPEVRERTLWSSSYCVIPAV